MIKRLFDFCAALGGLLVLWPLLLAIAIWVKRDSPGTVFFRQDRIGLHGKPFRIHKFRTMCVAAPKQGLQITVGVDARITRSGHFLRKYKLDELPQLLDVLFGQMSLVGPRPEVPKYVDLYPDDVRAKVLSVRPGMTDLASIEYLDENALLGQSQDPERTYIDEVMPAKLQYCVRYVEQQSLLLDLSIIFRTILAIVR